MAFLWRGRLYVVREVLGHWRERHEWWSTAAARALHGENGEGDRPAVPGAPSFAVWSGETDGELPGRVSGGAPVGAREDLHGNISGRMADLSEDDEDGDDQHGAIVDRGAAGGQDGTGRADRHEFLPDSECEVWRVEASTGRAFGNGVYDLSRTPARTPATDAWRLLQVAD